jgi:hypothetical protein
MMTGQAGVREIVKPWRGPFAFALESRRDPVPVAADWAHAFGQVARAQWERTRHRLSQVGWLRWLQPRARPAAVEEGEDGRTGAPALARAAQADFDIPGVLRVRTRDAWPADLAAVARHLGCAAKTPVGDPNVIVCFVDELAPRVLEHVEDDIAFGDDGVYVLGRNGRPLAHMRLSEPWGSALIVCRRGLGQVPLLSTAVDLAALHDEWIPLRAQTWTLGGANVLVVPGRSSGPLGRTAGADCLHPVPEGRLLVSPDGHTTVRMGKPTTIGRSTVPPVEKGDGRGPRPDAIVLLEEHEAPGLFVERIDSEAAAGRIAGGVTAGLRSNLAQRDVRHGQLAGRGWISARRAPGVATRLLREATRWKPCYVIRHPETATPETLAEGISRVLPDIALNAENGQKPHPEAPLTMRAKPRRPSQSSPSSEKTQRQPGG